MARMTSKRLVAILDLLNQRARAAQPTEGLCSVAKEVTGADGAAIALTVSGRPMSVMCATDETAHRLIEMENDVGEGPCTTACVLDDLVNEPDLSRHAGTRWPAFWSLARSTDAKAIVVLPVAIGAARLGVLSLYRAGPGQLSEDAMLDALVITSVIARSILLIQSGASIGALGDGLVHEPHWDLAVHQAAGMLAVQASTSLADAMVMMQAHAFGSGSTMSLLAEEVVARRVRFDGESASWVS